MNENLLNEQTMLQAGADRYARNEAKAKDHGQLTSAENRVFTQAVGNVAAALQKALDERGPGLPPPWVLPVASLGALTCAVIALRIAFTTVAERTGFQDVTRNIGRQIELELIAEAVRRSTVSDDMPEKDKRAAIKEGQKLYEKLAKRASKRRTLEFRGDAFSELAKAQGIDSPLEPDELVKIGNSLFSFVQQHTNLFTVFYEGTGEVDEAGIPAKVDFMGVQLTDDASKRLEHITEMESWMHPVYKPMLSKPRPWGSAFFGCYEEPKLASTVQIIRSMNKAHMKDVDAAVKAGAPFVQALNAIQEVPMQANMLVAHYMGWASRSDPLSDWMQETGNSLKGFPEPYQESKAGDGSNSATRSASTTTRRRRSARS